MPLEAKTSSFIFNEFIDIVLRPIPLPQPESLILHSKTTKNSASFAFYIDDIFGPFKTYQKQYIFLHEYFFPYMV